MGFKDWLKDIFSSEEENILEEFIKDELANKKWIEHYFLISFKKPQKEKEQDFSFRIMNAKEAILNLILNIMISADSTRTKKEMIFRGSLKKSVTIKVIEPKKDYYEFLIRFSDYNGKMGPKAKKTGGIFLREKKSGKKKEYLFSPSQDIILNKQNILPQIEFGLLNLLKIEPTDIMKSQKIMKSYEFIDNEPYYTELDGIQFFSYPIKKRIELYAKNQDFDKIVFQTGDGDFFLKEFIEEIMEKKNKNKHMKKYCKAVEELLKKFKVSFS